MLRLEAQVVSCVVHSGCVRLHVILFSVLFLLPLNREYNNWGALLVRVPTHNQLLLPPGADHSPHGTTVGPIGWRIGVSW